MSISMATMPQSDPRITGTTSPASMPPVSRAKVTQPQPITPAPVDTVHISSAAKAMQEVMETPAQTAREASGGDMQAQRLLAKEAAAKMGG